MSGLFSRRSAAPALLDCDVHCLDGTVFRLVLSKRATGQELLLQAFRHLKIQDASSLGLVFAGESGQQEWVNPSRALRKQISGNSPYHFYLQVRVYPINPQVLKDQQARYQVFLQVKKDILEGRLRCPQVQHVDALALLAQAELGDFEEETFPEGYLEHSGLLGPQTLRYKDLIVSTHKEMRGLTFDECEHQLLELAETQNQYGVTLYPVMDSDKRHINLGLGPSGVHVVMGTVHVAVYDWGSVLKVLSKYQTLQLKIRTPHTMAIHTMKFTCPSGSICKQLGLLCLEMQGVYKEVAPYSSTFRRMWSGRGGQVLVAPLTKLRHAHDSRRHRSSSDLSTTRKQLSRKHSFQGGSGALPSHKKLTLKRSQSETFLAKLSEMEPPRPVVTPQLRRYQETGEPVAASSPYTTPKPSLVLSEDIAMVVGQHMKDNSSTSSSSKAVSDSSLNNILDSSGLPVRNILRRPTLQADEAVGQMERGRVSTPVSLSHSPQPALRVDPQPPRLGGMQRTASSTPTSVTQLEGTVSNGGFNPSPIPTALPTSYSPVLSESLCSPISSPEGSVIMRNKPGRTRNSANRRRSSLFVEAENAITQESPFLDAHIASMIFETSQQEEYSCEL